MALRELLISLGVEVRGQDRVTDLETGLDRVVNRAKQLAEAMAALSIVGGIKNLITDTIEMGRKVIDMSNVLGVATDDLQSFQYAANMVGASTELASRSLRYLNRQLGLASEGNKAASKDFHQLGVHIKDTDGNLRPMMDILEDVADSFQKLKNDPERTAFAVKTFGRAGAGLVPILKGGREGIRGFREEFERLGGGLHEDFLREAKEADRGITRLTLGFNMMKSRIVLGVLPAFETMLGWLQKGTRAFGDLADKTYFAQTALLALGTLAAVLLAPILLELLPIVAGFGLLYLIVDDLYTLFQGGDSILGRVIDNLFGVGASKRFVQEVKDEAVILGDKLRALLPTLQEVGGNLKKAWEEPHPALKKMLDTLGAFLRLLAGAAEATADLLRGDWKAVGKDIDRAGNAVFGKFYDPSQQLVDYLPGGVDPSLKNWYVRDPRMWDFARPNMLPTGFIGPPEAPPFGPPTAPVVVHNETKVTVQGATTNEETGHAVAKATSDAHAANNRKAAAAVRAAVVRGVPVAGQPVTP